MAMTPFLAILLVAARAHNHLTTYSQAPDMTVLNLLKANIKSQLDATARFIHDHGGAGHQNHSTRTMLPKVVRLAFHDCVGGCDGCIDLTDEGNLGLKKPQQFLEAIYDANFSSKMTRADFWANSATYALEYGASLDPHKQTGHVHRRRLLHGHGSHSHDNEMFHYMWGRKDCATTPAGQHQHGHSHEKFPQGTGNLSHVLDWFKKNFNFTTTEVVAAMGAHTLGRAAVDHSGFEGPWVHNEDVLNNAYYTAMLRPNFWTQGLAPNSSFDHQHVHRRLHAGHTHTTGSPAHPHGMDPKFQWNARDNETMMLNADMSLIRSFVVPNMTTGKVDCTYSTCANSTATMGTVHLYAHNNTKWLMAFAKVWMKMMSMGSHQLYEITTNTTLPASCIKSGVCKAATTTASPMGTTMPPKGTNGTAMTTTKPADKTGGAPQKMPLVVVGAFIALVSAWLA